MIRNFRDHAANERTFLAWVRTAVAVMAFGFVVERFELVLKTASLSSHLDASQSYDAGIIAGILSMILGATMLVVAIFRFVTTARDIDRCDERPLVGAKLSVALAGLIGMVGVSSLAYVSHALSAVR